MNTSDPRRVTFAAERVWVLANPRAGRGLGMLTATEIVRRLRRAGVQVTPDDRPPWVAEPPAGGLDACVVVGGDGTLRAAVDRLLNLMPGDMPAVVPVPLGTANLMGRHLGLRRTLLHAAAETVADAAGRLGARGMFERRGVLGRTSRRVVPLPRERARRIARATHAALLRGHARRLDVGRVEGGRGTFLLMAGVGFDADVVAAVDRRRVATPGPITLASYLLPAATAGAKAWASGVAPVQVWADGRRVFGPGRAVVMIANAPEYGVGFPVIPAARSDDGLLDVACFPCHDAGDLVKLAASAAAGWHTGMSGVAVAKGRDVRVEAASSSQVPVQLDGDAAGSLPLHVRVSEAAVPFARLGDGVMSRPLRTG